MNVVATWVAAIRFPASSRSKSHVAETFAEFAEKDGIQIDRSAVSYRASLALLAKARHFSSIDVTETDVTADGVAKFKSLFPACLIAVDPEIEAQMNRAHPRVLPSQ